MTLDKQQISHITKEQLAAAYDQMLKQNDPAQAQKLLDLYEKQQHQTLSISFAGHFSSGKSSMINTLLQADILPKSPVPTSANIVRITSGEGVARIYYKHQQPVEYREPYDIEQIKTHSKNKSDIKQIDISTSTPVIPQNRYIVDTPGIDAADDADRVITEGALHVADYVFYIMDYNHVQSEVNLGFLKYLQEQFIPFSIIINQIDKHNPEELSFTTFQKNIKRTFTQWGLSPEHIYYTSLIENKSRHDDLNQVKQALFHMLKSDYEDIQTIDQAVEPIVNAHKHFLKEQTTDRLYAIKQKQTSSGDQDDINALDDKITYLINQPETIEQDFKHELTQTLNNAYLMPAVTRDKAESFLQSLQPGFKVGLIGSKHKTEKVKENRLLTFLNALQDNMQTTIQWQLQDKMIHLLKYYHLNEDELIQRVQSIQPSYTKDDILSHIKKGAKVNGQYILNFTSEIANSIKQTYRQVALPVIAFIKHKVTEQNDLKLQTLRQEKQDLQQNQVLEQKKNNLNQALNDALIAIDTALQTESADKHLLAQADEALEQQQTVFLKQSGQTMKQTTSSEYFKEETSLSEASDTPHGSNSDHISNELARVIETVESVPGFSSYVSDLKHKQERLDQQNFTVSLFGAFSAGKSSFANALLGEAVLPATPNPTTATVNRINPVSEQYPHATVIVQLKLESTLVNDLLISTKELSPPDDSLNAILKWIESEDIQHNQSLSKVYQSYLQAFLSGYHAIKDSIGQQINISLEDFADYVSDETKASFIESIDLYYDCALTRQGITLVDTPGADSVNARHTNVAFDYIKQADALLYVTYYNHALSKADKTFLMQLGRVKGAFELDKMFFIVNAVDLAANETDLEHVTSYVTQQLTQLGIRLPQLYPVSSRQSLKEKKSGDRLNDKMNQFEHDFNRFIHSDLTALITESALWDIKRTRQALLNYKNAVQMDQADKNAFKHTLESDLNNAINRIEEMNVDAQTSQLTQKIDKQIHYIWERVSLRYNDLFKVSFNPTTITASGREAKMQLKQSLQTLIDDVAYELLQELRAVSLRVEQTEQTLAKDVYQQMVNKCQTSNNSFNFPAFEGSNLSTPDYEAAFESIDLTQFNDALSVFKNTKRFFADNIKETMKDNIHATLEPLAIEYLNNNQSIMINHYMTEWTNHIQSMKADMIAHLKQQVNAQVKMLETPVDTQDLNQRIETLDRILNREGY